MRSVELVERLEEAGIDIEAQPGVIEDVLAEVEASDEPGATETAHLLRHILPSVPSPRGIESDDPVGSRGVRRRFGRRLIFAEISPASGVPPGATSGGAARVGQSVSARFPQIATTWSAEHGGLLKRRISSNIGYRGKGFYGR